MVIIYRVYQIEDEGKCFGFYDFEHKSIVTQEMCICNSKEEFKEMMKLQWGDIPFRHTKDLKVGDRFITIISYNAYDADRYLVVEDQVCAECGKHFCVNKLREKSLPGGELSQLERICQPLYLEKLDSLRDARFCSHNCKNKYIEKVEEEFNKYSHDNDIIQDTFITRENFPVICGGYIYMITKRSTGEFYVGQTKYVPMFRWMEHLKTDRFDQKYIQDYIFEILESVDYNTNILEREAYWINKKYKENPTKSLNIQKPIPKNEVVDLFEEENNLKEN